MKLKFVILLFVAFSAPLFGEGMLPTERDALWREAEQQLRTHPRVIYNDGQTAVPDYPGFIVSNEMAHWTMRPPPGQGELLVGFATTVNFNLLATRQNTAFINADQSIEPLVTMMSFWKPLFLVSENPGELVANLGAHKLKPGETADQAFLRVYSTRQTRDHVNESLAALDKKLAGLVKAGKISDFDRRFCTAVLRDHWLPAPQPMLPPGAMALLSMFGFDAGPQPGQRVSLFRNVKNSHVLFPTFAQTYWARAQNGAMEELWHTYHKEPPLMGELLTKIKTPDNAAAKMKKVSFLEDAGFQNVKKVLAADGDQYALTTVQDPKFWEAAAAAAKKKNVKLTDFYLSNIPGAAKDEDPNFDASIGKGLKLMPNNGAVAIYEAHFEPPNVFETQIFDPASQKKTGLRRLVSGSGAYQSACFVKLGSLVD